jgi:hypothetical protein
MISTTPRSPRPERNDPSLQDHRGGSLGRHDRALDLGNLGRPLTRGAGAACRRMASFPGHPPRGVKSGSRPIQARASIGNYGRHDR